MSMNRAQVSNSRALTRSRWVVLSGALLLAAAIGGGLAACGSDEDTPAAQTNDGGEEGGNTTDSNVTPLPDGESISDAGADVACLDATPDAEAIDCTGKCGPVKDPCTGVIKQCGGCTNGTTADGGDAGPRVCDLATNSCAAPKRTCADLGAECGTIKNSCGDYLDCPDGNPKGCGAGKECDPDTHKCRDCQAVTCKDLGIECGHAWLGCGEDIPANYTDCGSCGAGKTCNNVFHTCEPTVGTPSCTAVKTAKELCDAAKASTKGVECGVISNGCGGTVNCDTVPGFGCKNGESCGVHGIANRCDPKSTPDECKAQGKNCGTIKSACTGATINCGDCATGQVCNANGVCGPPCTPKTCADFAAFQCGTFDDSCGGTLTCGTCPNGPCDNTTHTCCAGFACNTTYAGKCGLDLPNGCGQNVIDCTCTNPATCTADGGVAPAPPVTTGTGMCCTPKTATSYTSQGQCGTNLPNGCGLNNINASCGGGKECVNNATGQPGPAPPPGTVGSCCTRTDTCTQAAGQCAPVQNSCRPAGTTVSCNGNCSTVGTTCFNNNCCTPAAACTLNGGEGGECNTTHNPVTPGCGSSIDCACKGGRTCWCTNHTCVPGVDGAGVCKSALTCGTAPYAGKCGTQLDNGVGGKIDCGCATGKTCDAATPGTIGDCQCNNGTGAPYNCGNVPNGPSSPTGDKCGPFNDGCGGTITCNCPGGQTCNTSANPNVCCTPAVCPAQGIGSACGALTNGCGGTINCGCPSGAGNENFTCTAGTCQCVKDTCKGRTGTPPDRCGGLLSCGG